MRSKLYLIYGFVHIILLLICEAFRYANRLCIRTELMTTNASVCKMCVREMGTKLI